MEAHLSSSLGAATNPDTAETIPKRCILVCDAYLYCAGTRWPSVVSKAEEVPNAIVGENFEGVFEIQKKSEEV